MATEAQNNANRANARKSTGPTTDAGKQKSAANSVKHNLQANLTTIFNNNPSERTQYDELKQKLFDQIQPEGELELQAFERHAFQADRARQMEIDCQQRWLNEPNSDSWFLSALEVHNELYLYEQTGDIPATLPVHEMRKGNRINQSAFQVASMIISKAPEARAMHANPQQTKPIHEPIKLTTELLVKLANGIKPSQPKYGSQGFQSLFEPSTPLIPSRLAAKPPTKHP